MAIDNLPDALIVPTRDDLVAKFLRDVAFRAPNTKMGDGQLANIDAAVTADMVLPLYAESVRQAELVSLDGVAGKALEQRAIDKGLVGRLPAAPAAGFVVADVSTGGALGKKGQTIKHPQTGARYEITTTAVYAPGDPVPVVGLTTGPTSNLAAGTVLQWESPPPGWGANAAVFEQSDGDGLTGGRDEETDAEIRERIRDANANPASAANDTAYQNAVVGTPGVGVQAAFTYPAISGPGVGAVAFLVRPASAGASRAPNGTQIALVRANVLGQMPRSDSTSFCTITEYPIAVGFRLRWTPNVSSWLDSPAWPPYDVQWYYVDYASGTHTATTFWIKTAAASPVAPTVGQTIAFWDATNKVFVRKRIGAVSGANPWQITVDISNGTSDTAYVPFDAQPAGPWSDTLQDVADTIVAYFDTLGPGEQVATPYFDEGARQRRQPQSPAAWPSTITSKMTLGAESLPAVQSLSMIVPTLPYDTPVGTLGVTSKLITLGALIILPL